MTTIGYGDMYPVGSLGKILGMIIVMCGILVIALPTTVVGSNFNAIYLATEPNHNFDWMKNTDRYECYACHQVGLGFRV